MDHKPAPGSSRKLGLDFRAALVSTAGAMNEVDNIIRWENGELDEVEEFAFFERLVASGDIYHLQGSYGRRARDLGLI